MTELLSSIEAASSWNEYYSAYQAVYREVIESRWGLGKATFANQLHHTAIPDVSGVTLNSAHWAVYSQPSTATLEAFLEVFSQLLISEPKRQRTNRYLFVVPSEHVLTRETANNALGDPGRRLDYWLGNLSDEIDFAYHLAALQSINVMFASTNNLLDLKKLARLSAQDAVEQAAEQISQVDFLALDSTVSPAMRKAYAMSSVLMAGVRAQMAAPDLIKLCGSSISVASFVAVDRAHLSGWDEDRIGALKRLLELAPPNLQRYQVQPGDILTRLVRQFYEQPFESLWPILKALNPHIKNPNLIRVGEVINFPKLDDEHPSNKNK